MICLLIHGEALATVVAVIGLDHFLFVLFCDRIWHDLLLRVEVSVLDIRLVIHNIAVILGLHVTARQCKYFVIGKIHFVILAACIDNNWLKENLLCVHIQSR